MIDSHPTRRVFLQTSTAMLAASSIPTYAASTLSEVRLGLIGCGIRGRTYYPAVRMACDPDQTRLDSAAKAIGLPAASAVRDLRQVLDSPEIDAVVIATPDHWHAPAALLALEAGKHVYVEKPASHNFRESQLMLAAANRSKFVVQHGTQQRTRPFTRDAIAMLHSGVIGEVLVAKAWNIQRRDNIGHAQPSPPPPEIDYQLWLGPAEHLPFQTNRFHSTWHWWKNFGTGDIGNDGAHELDYARWGLGVNTLPHKVSTSGGKYAFDDDQEFADTASCSFEYLPVAPEEKPRQLLFEMRLWSTNYPHNCDSGVEFYGTHGQMLLSKRGKLRILDDRNKVIREEFPTDPPGLPHLEDFLSSIRNSSSPAAPMVEAHRSVALAHLANISLSVGRSLQLDPKAETIVNDPEAIALLIRKYHPSHWAIPRELRG